MTLRKLLVERRLPFAPAGSRWAARRTRARSSPCSCSGPRSATPRLGDNITEVIIARVAQRGGVEIAGKEEFRARIGAESDQRAQVCLDDSACTVARRRLAGRAAHRRRKHRHARQTVFVQPQLEQRRDGQDRRSGFFRLVEGGVEDPDPRRARRQRRGVPAARRARPDPGRHRPRGRARRARQRLLGRDAAHLGHAARRASTTCASRPTRASRGRPRSRFVQERELTEIKLKPDNLPQRRSWPPTVAYGTAGLAVASVAARRLPGRALTAPADGRHAARRPRTTTTRRSASRCTPTSASARAPCWGSCPLFYFIHYRDDIFGRTERTTTKRPERCDAEPRLRAAVAAGDEA